MFIAVQPFFVPQTQIFVADALATGQHRIHELFRLKLVAIALTTNFKPLHGIPSSVLNFECFDAPTLLVVGEYIWNVSGFAAVNFELARQFNCIF